MKRPLVLAAICAIPLALSGCGKSGNANEAAQPDNVEMPAEEAIHDVDASAAPAPEASGDATTAGAASQGPAPASSGAQ